MATERLTPADYRALAEFRCQLRRFLRFSEQAARAAGLASQQHQLLLALKGMPEGMPATIGALAERLQVRHHTTVGLVDRMEARGLVRRSHAGTDRRQVFVRLTSRGEGMLPRLSLSHRAELRSMVPSLLRALEELVGERARPPARRRR